MTNGKYYLYSGDEIMTIFDSYDDYIEYFKSCLKPLGLGTHYLFSRKRDVSKTRYAVDIYISIVKAGRPAV